MENSAQSLFCSVLLIQIPNFEGSFHSVQYDESIHAPDLRISFFNMRFFEKHENISMLQNN
jgi:hypothetical protein